MTQEAKIKKSNNYLGMVKKGYLYLSAYFCIAIFFVYIFASKKVSNPLVFYLISGFFLIISFCLFLKINNLRHKQKNKKYLIIRSLIEIIIGCLIIYVISKLLCISSGGPINLY